MEKDQTEGFIKLYRKFFDSELWTEKRELSRAEAWLDLLTLGQYRTTSRLIKGKSITIEVGELRASRRYLAKRWGWGEQKTRSFLKMLEDKEQITQKLVQGENIINICKYKKYNGVQQNNLETTHPIIHPKKELSAETEETYAKNGSKNGNPPNNPLKKLVSIENKGTYKKGGKANNPPNNPLITHRQPKEEERKERKEINKGKKLPCCIFDFLGDEFKSSEAFCNAWIEWEEYRKQRKLGAWVELTCKKKAKEFTSWGVKRTIEAISTAIASNWAGIFPPKEDKAKSKGLSLQDFRKAYRWSNNIEENSMLNPSDEDKRILNADLNTLQTKYKTIYNELSEQASETFGALRKFLNKRKT